MNLVRPPRDHRVDRPDVDALQGAELTGTNRPRACYTHFIFCDCSYPLCGSGPPHTPCGGAGWWLDPKQTRPHDTNPPGVGRCGSYIHSFCAGGHGWRETPGPIPNPEVKPPHADGTAHASGWESRTLPHKPLKSVRGPDRVPHVEVIDMTGDPVRAPNHTHTQTPIPDLGLRS